MTNPKTGPRTDPRTDPRINDVLDFWIEEVGGPGWWKTDLDLDQRMRDRFLGLHAEARAGGLSFWQSNARGSLALILILDQFSRNMFRDTPQAFASDAQALRTAYGAIARGFDLHIPEPERMFFYLPFEHAESLPRQERCMRLMMLRVPSLDAQGIEACRKHREVIRRFGRFPSRNAILGRTDTAAELAYRAEGGYMSGAPGSGPAPS